MRVLQEQVASILQRDAAVSGHPGSIPRSTVVTTTPTDCTTTSTFSMGSIPVSLAPIRMSVPSPQAYNAIPNSAPNPLVPQQVPAPQQASVPQPISAAASNLAATLQASLGNGSGIYSGLTMDHLRANPSIASQASAVMANALHGVPPLNPSSHQSYYCK